MNSNPQCEHICHLPKYVLKRFIGALAMQACCSVTRNTILNVLCNQHGRLITLHKLPLRSIMHHIVITYAAVAQQIAPLFAAHFGLLLEQATMQGNSLSVS